MKYNFIIPYRNRKEHLDEFIRRFSEIMKKNPELDMEFFIIHQMNAEEFNRGALKNIGFLEVCKTRPDGLFIFHDVDVYPTYWGSIKYEAKKGEFRRPVLNSADENLGLICCCWKEEFEKTNGFANYYGWGAEDGALYFRAKKNNIFINELNMINYRDKRYIINYEHPRNAEKEHYFAEINGNYLEKEKQTNDSSNGITNVDYNVLFEMELVPKFKVINVDFKLKEN